MRYDTCRQCVRRRIQCDMQSPECAKCLKKGLSCSGVGKQYRFVQGCIFGKQSAKLQLALTPTTKRVDSHCRSENDSVVAAGISPVAEAYHETIVRDGIVPHLAHDPMLVTDWFSLRSIDAQKRMLFDYFSSTIAPAMVVFDTGANNGYRSIFLPLALEDDLVQRTISVCSALHIGRKQPKLFEQAERDRTAIIQRLRYNALHSSSEEIFNPSAWATIILLLVAETVTGEHEFTYLYNMLQSHAKMTATVCKDQEIVSFLDQQTQMFNLFTPLFLGPEIGLIALQSIEARMDFIPPGDGHDTCFVSIVLKQSIGLARDMYLAQVDNIQLDTEPLVEKLILLLVSIDEQPGMHAFVWPYFIAAATTKNLGYRSFFVKKLLHIYDKTGMRNVLSSISMLEQLWKLPSGQNWTQNRSILQRTLVM